MYFIFDIGGTNTRLCLLDNLTKPVVPEIFKTPKTFDEVAELIEDFLKKNEYKPIKYAVGGVAGVFNQDSSMLLTSPNLKKWIGKPIKSVIQKLCNCEVTLMNDASLGGIGEAVYGAGKEYNIVGYLTISTGIGGAKIINGQLEKTSIGFEPGHQIISFSEEIADPKFKTLEDFASGSSIQRQFHTEPSEIKDEEFWERIHYYLSIGIHNTIIHWSPDVIVLGGSMMGSIKITKIESYLKKTMKIFPKVPELKNALLGSYNGIYGALHVLKTMD